MAFRVCNRGSEGSVAKAAAPWRTRTCRAVALCSGLLILPFNVSAQIVDLGNGLFLEDGEISTSALIERAAAANKHFCMVVVGNPGALAPAIGNVALSSKVAGGYSGTAQITTTNASYSAFLEAPVAFVASPNLNGPVTFSGEFSGNGATNFATILSPGNVRLKRGTTNISADLTATIQGSSFASGHYAAQLVLRCE
ncbi:MAG: hypothetical protein AB3N20_20495 [Rhizobiaceae bacterium]